MKFEEVFAPEEVSHGGRNDLQEKRASSVGTMSANHGLESVGSVMKRIRPELVILEQKLSPN